MKCGVHIDKEFYAYVVFSGGITMFQWIFEHTPSSRTTSPDGNIIVDGAERFCFVKVLVQPSSSGKEASGFHGTSFHNIMKCYVNFRKVLYANVVSPSGKTLRLKCFGTGWWGTAKTTMDQLVLWVLRHSVKSHVFSKAAG